MRIKRPVAVLLTFGTAFALTPTAGAQEAVTPKFSFACAGICPGGPSRTSFFDKPEYAPGEKITITVVWADYRCFGPVTSEGFTAPAVLRQVPRPPIPGGVLVGETTAGKVPGTYEAKIDCTGTPVVDTFTIKAPPPGKPAPKPKPKPPVVKPKGAPDTGGGGTAR